MGILIKLNFKKFINKMIINEINKLLIRIDYKNPKI